MIDEYAAIRRGLAHVVAYKLLVFVHFQGGLGTGPEFFTGIVIWFVIGVRHVNKTAIDGADGFAETETGLEWEKGVGGFVFVGIVVFDTEDFNGMVLEFVRKGG